VHGLFVGDPSAPCFPTHSHIPPSRHMSDKAFIFCVKFHIVAKDLEFFSVTNSMILNFFFEKFEICMVQVGAWNFFLSYFVNSQNWLMDHCHLSYITKLKERTMVPYDAWQHIAFCYHS
jgi:hypothetical protein